MFLLHKKNGSYYLLVKTEKEPHMTNTTQTKTKEILQVKFLRYFRRYREILTVPEYKFLETICLGILKSCSVINHRIAQKLCEPITVKKTCERFTRHLNKENLSNILQETTMKKQCRGIDNDTGIIIDDSDIIKSKAKKMEGLKKVRDGSTGRYDQSGYNLLNIIAFKNNGEGYEIKPISSDLIARDLEMDSISQILGDRLVDIAITVNGKGVHIGDRGLDTRKFFSFLKQHGLDFIVRLTGKRSLIVNGNEQKFIEVATSVKFTHQFNLKGSNRQIRCGIKRVELRTDPHPRRNPETIEAWLIICRFISDEKNKSGFFYFLCDFPNQPHLSKPAIMEKVVRMYGIRWKIEEVHKQIKQDYGWEKIQLTSYTRLKTMNQILLIAVCFLYSLKRYAYLFLEAFPSIMKYCNSRWKKIYDFIYYRLSILVQMCFTSVTRYNINPYAGRWLKSIQLEIPYIKNGGM